MLTGTDHNECRRVARLDGVKRRAIPWTLHIRPTSKDSAIDMSNCRGATGTPRTGRGPPHLWYRIQRSSLKPLSRCRRHVEQRYHIQPTYVEIVTFHWPYRTRRRCPSRSRRNRHLYIVMRIHPEANHPHRLREHAVFLVGETPGIGAELKSKDNHPRTKQHGAEDGKRGTELPEELVEKAYLECYR